MRRSKTTTPLLLTALLLAGCEVNLTPQERQAVVDGVSTRVQGEDGVGEPGDTHAGQDETLALLVESVARIEQRLDAIEAALGAPVGSVSEDLAALDDAVQAIASDVAALPTDVAAPSDVSDAVTTLQTEIALSEDNVIAGLQREVIYAWDAVNGATEGSHAALVAAVAAGRELLVARQANGSSDWTSHRCARAYYDWSLDVVACYQTGVASEDSSAVGVVIDLENEGIRFQVISSAGGTSGQVSTQLWDIGSANLDVLPATTIPLDAMLWTAAL